MEKISLVGGIFMEKTLNFVSINCPMVFVYKSNQLDYLINFD